MRFIKEIEIEIPKVKQEFELGDLTIFIGRPNCGKTRILKEIYRKSMQFENMLKGEPSPTRRESRAKTLGIKMGGEIKSSMEMPLFISSPRSPQNNINAFTIGLNRIKDSAKKMDPTITDFGNHGIIQENTHRELNIQGTGIQNVMQIVSGMNETRKFILVDEPESSQFPTGKISVLERILELLDEKQIVLATHDPTLINQHIIKNFLSLNKNRNKIVVYSFCGDEFKKIDFDANLDTEIHCGYLNQSFSGKPIHLVVEGQTEFYAFQALLYKYCLHKGIHNFPKFINKISISHLAGGQWKINIHHLPDPDHYKVLVILDGEYKEEVRTYDFPINFETIKSVSEAKKDSVNVLCLKSENIEKAFEEIFPRPEEFSKPVELSEHIWRSQDEIIKQLKDGSEEGRQIYEIIEWVISKAKE